MWTSRAEPWSPWQSVDKRASRRLSSPCSLLAGDVHGGGRQVLPGGAGPGAGPPARPGHHLQGPEAREVSGPRGRRPRPCLPAPLPAPCSLCSGFRFHVRSPQEWVGLPPAGTSQAGIPAGCPDTAGLTLNCTGSQRSDLVLGRPAEPRAVAAGQVGRRVAHPHLLVPHPLVASDVTASTTRIAAAGVNSWSHRRQALPACPTGGAASRDLSAPPLASAAGGSRPGAPSPALALCRPKGSL